MRHFIRTRIGNPADRLARRLRTARPGSVLILVVALLVLMALIGTAWLTTARTDRHTSQQNAENVKLELLVESAVNLAQSAIVDDVISGGQFRSRPGVRPLDYESYDAPSRDLFLASRVPLRDPGSGTPYWEFISGAPTLSGFESPYTLDGSGVPIPNPPHRYDVRLTNGVANAVPTFINVPGMTEPQPALRFPGFGNFTALAADADKDGIADSALFRMPYSDGSGLIYYGAVRILDNNSAINAAVAWRQNVDADPATSPPAGQFFPTNINLYDLLRGAVADKDNQIAGLERYRNTATSADNAGMAGATPFPVPPPVLTPVVNETGNGALTAFEFLFAGEALWKQLGSRPGNPGFNAFFNPANEFFNLDTQYKNLAIGESMAMAYKFVLGNPFASPSVLESQDRLALSVYTTPPVQSVPYGPHEAAVDDPTMWPARPGWYPGNFDRASPDGMPLRAILVARNAVSNTVPSQFVDMGEWDSTGATDYIFGHRVRWKPAGDNVQRTYVCVRANGPALGGWTEPGLNVIGDNNWELMPWHEAPTKMNVNSATFGQLWTAFWSVMNAGSATAPATLENPTDPPSPTDPKRTQDPIRVGGAAPYPSPATASPPTQRGRLAPPASRKHFRSPQRDPGNLNLLTMAPDPVVYQMSPYEVMRLRAALAAVNAIDIRDRDDDVTSRRIVLRAFAYGAPDPAERIEGEVNVMVFGTEAQPYITEVYADNFNLPPSIASGTPEPSANPEGYVAVELHNPTDQPITLTNWNLGIIDRRRAGATPAPLKPYPDMTIRAITGFTGFGGGPTTPAPTIPPRGYLVLENYDPTTAVGHRPLSSGITPTTGEIAGFFTVRNLHEVLRQAPDNNLIPGGELVLLRPRRADGVLENPTDPTNPYNELDSVVYIPPAATGAPTAQAASLATMAPVDSFDFTGFTQAAGETFRVWHYARANGAGTPNNHWRFVYPGRWDAAHRWSANPYRQEGVETAAYDWATGATDPWVAPGTAPTPITLMPPNASISSYQATNFFANAIQLNHRAFGGFNKPNGPPPWVFPFGGFARNGDLLQVPFIGGYTIRRSIPGLGSDHFLEMNPVTIDSIFAHDFDSDFPEIGESDGTPGSNDLVEHLGRFAVLEDFDTYNWAADLFDHLTIESPQDDHLPAVDPWSYPGDPPHGVNGVTSSQPASVTFGRVRAVPTGVSIQGSVNLMTFDVDGNPRDRFYEGSRIRFLSGAARGNQRVIDSYVAVDQELTWTTPLERYDPATNTLVPVLPSVGDLFQILGPSEDKTGIEGLVNVNTAPLEVLAAVPMLDDPTLNRALAEAIVAYRAANPATPFTSLFDLNRVPGFREALGDPETFPFDNTHGDYTPYTYSNPPPAITSDGVVGDFESHYLMMTRVSNLLTTRSDTFTVYVEVQGWQDVGSDTPARVVQRRQALIADRNPITQTNRVLTTVTVPND